MSPGALAKEIEVVTWSRNVSAALVVAFALTACGGGGSSPSLPHTGGAPVGTGTSTPSGPFNAAAFTCPSSDAVTSATRAGGAAPEALRRPPQHLTTVAAEPGLIAVTYDRAVAQRLGTGLAAREQSLGASVVRSLDFPRIGVTTRVLSVAPAQVATISAALRAEAGVRSVGPAGGRRAPLGVSTPYYTNDPYFNGFSQTVAPSGGTPPPATYHAPPYDESASVPGQWGMHAIGLESAFGYSQAGNGSGIHNPSALGSTSVKIAIIDSGADTTHPELASKIVYQKCFITNPSGAPSTSNFTTDQDGHGTDVAGIAAAADNNGLGFTGAGGASVIYDYRVLPTPDDHCSDPTSTDQQCTASTSDIAAAIHDAIAQGVNVISLSLGGGSCTNGQDPDATEGAAIAAAVAANIVVVAASGNDGKAAVSAPGCDPGVIAAGATALADGAPNGAGNSNGSAASPVEYVASYSSYGNPGAAAHNAAAWGIVAPGGDPSSAESSPNATTVDDLHWIDDIWTSTPFDQKNFGGNCTGDYPSHTSVPDCRILIAGTSMSAPTVAGAAALILAVNGSYQSPSAMKQLLCTTAHDIGDPREGCGRLNVYRAMAVALGDPNPPPI